MTLACLHDTAVGWDAIELPWDVMGPLHGKWNHVFMVLPWEVI